MTARKDGQGVLPGTGRRRQKAGPQKPDSAVDPRLAAVLADRDAWIALGGRLAWQQEQTRRRAALVARLRERRRNGYRDQVRDAA
jgi:hypothetical protein